MLKRIFILVFILSTVVLMAMSPMSTHAVSNNTHALQETIEVPDVGITLEVDVTDPDSDNGGLPNNTLVYALVAIIAIAVVIGGISLINRRQ
jgi:hypothetical protein